MVFEDINGDGIMDDNEPGIEGVEVFLLDSNLNLLATDTTDDNGKYKFKNLEPGTYMVVVEQPDGFDPTVDRDGINTPNKVNDIVVEREDILDVDFGYEQTGTPCEEDVVQLKDKFNDVNYNNNDGDRVFAGQWEETDALGGGPVSGNVFIEDGSLVMQEPGSSISRPARLEKFARGRVQVDYETCPGTTEDDLAVVEVSADGTTFVEVLSITGYSGAQFDWLAASIEPQFFTNDFVVRIRIVSGFEKADDSCLKFSIFFLRNLCDCADADGDGVCDNEDNCPNDANSDQQDLDADGIILQSFSFLIFACRSRR